MGTAPTTSTWGPRIRAAVERRVGIDLRALAALRIGLGGLLLLDLALRARSLRAHYTDFGMLPRAALHGYYGTLGRISIHALSGAAWVQVLLFVVAGIVAFALLCGYRATTATVLSWLLLASLHARNPLLLNAGDSLLRRLLMWGMFLPLGARWSIDAGQGERPSEDRVASIASLALLLQVVLMYLTNGVIKLRGDVWPSGEALRIVFGVDQLTTGFGHALAGQPTVLVLLGHAWLLLVFSAPALLLLRGRSRAALAGAFILAHVGMLLTLHLGIFPLVAVIALLVFLPTPIWDRLEFELSTRKPFQGGTATAAFRHATVPTPRGQITRLRERPPTSLRDSVSAFGASLPAVLLALVLLWNAASLGYVGLPTDAAPVDPREHRWDMFAPHPLGTDVWYVVPGTLESGRQIDAYRGGAVVWDRPPDTAATYPSARWRKSLMDLWRPQYAPLRPAFAGYLCRRWNERHDDHLETLSIAVVESPVRLDGPDPTRRVELWNGSCPS